MIRSREISPIDLMKQHLAQIHEVNPAINAVTELFEDEALEQARRAEADARAGAWQGALHGVPFSVKDSIDVAGRRCTAGTLGRKNAPPASRDATLVARLRQAGGIPIAKTNLPDLLFSFESDNLIFGRTNNPYDLSKTSGGSSGGEAALIAACGSPLGLGSDAAGSVRVPAAFCGITSIKPTSGRLPRTGHMPPAGGWIEALWQIGPMARRPEDLALAMELLAKEDEQDFTSPPAALVLPGDLKGKRVAFFTDNGFARCRAEVQNAVRDCASTLAAEGAQVEEVRPPGIEHAYELELALLGADGAQGIDAYLGEIGSSEVHPLLKHFVDQMRPHAASGAELAKTWAHWDEYRSGLSRFFHAFDAILCPVYTQTALPHHASMTDENFRGFSYTMAWNVAGLPAAVVRCGEHDGLPVSVQVVANKWRDLLAIEICHVIESAHGGWQAPVLEPARAVASASY
jgi:amidase